MFEASIRSTSMLSMKPMPSMVADRLLLLPRPDPMPVLYLWVVLPNVDHSSVLESASAVSTVLAPVALVLVSV